MKSWLDHVLCSRSVDRLISNVNVLHDYISSDHRPFSIDFSFVIPGKCITSLFTNSLPVNKPSWAKADECFCNKANHLSVIDNYYNSIISSVSMAVDECSPASVKQNENHFNVPGWSKYVADQHELAREAFWTGSRKGNLEIALYHRACVEPRLHLN